MQLKNLALKYSEIQACFSERPEHPGEPDGKWFVEIYLVNRKDPVVILLDKEERDLLLERVRKNI